MIVRIISSVVFHGLLLALLAINFPASKASANESPELPNNFVKITSKAGLSISIPEDWRAMTDEEIELANEELESLLDDPYMRYLDGYRPIDTSDFDYPPYILVMHDQKPKLTKTQFDEMGQKIIQADPGIYSGLKDKLKNKINVSPMRSQYNSYDRNSNVILHLREIASQDTNEKIFLYTATVLASDGLISVSGYSDNKSLSKYLPLYKKILSTISLSSLRTYSEGWLGNAKRFLLIFELKKFEAPAWNFIYSWIGLLLLLVLITIGEKFLGLDVKTIPLLSAYKLYLGFVVFGFIYFSIPMLAWATIYFVFFTFELSETILMASLFSTYLIMLFAYLISSLWAMKRILRVGFLGTKLVTAVGERTKVNSLSGKLWWAYFWRATLLSIPIRYIFVGSPSLQIFLACIVHFYFFHHILDRGKDYTLVIEKQVTPPS